MELVCFPVFNKITHKSGMLRKNTLATAHPPEVKTSVSTQTDEFLLYYSIEEKLSQLLQKYRLLQTQYEQALNTIDYLQHKNKYLETSLCDVTYAFRNDRTERNLEHIRDIKELEETICREARELQDVRNFVISRLAEVEKGELSKISQLSSKKSQKGAGSQVLQPPKMRSVSASGSGYASNDPSLQASNRGEKKEKGLLTNRQGSYLQQNLIDSYPSQTIQKVDKPILAMKSTDTNLPENRYYKLANLPLEEKEPSSYRQKRSQVKEKIKKKKMDVDKENICQEKLVRMEAEIKYRQFMADFKNSAKEPKGVQGGKEKTYFYAMQSGLDCISKSSSIKHFFG